MVVDNPNELFHPGMNGRASIYCAKAHVVLEFIPQIMGKCLCCISDGNMNRAGDASTRDPTAALHYLAQRFARFSAILPRASPAIFWKILKKSSSIGWALPKALHCHARRQDVAGRRPA